MTISNDQKLLSGDFFRWMLLFVFSVLFLGYYTIAHSADDAASPHKSPVVNYMTEQERSAREKGVLPTKTKEIVNAEAKAVVSTNANIENETNLRTVAGCQNSIRSVLKDQPIEFLPGRSTLSRVSIETVKDLSVIIQDCKSVKVIISGHTDSRGTPITNQRLSGLRASSVMQQFIKIGVKKNRLRAVGFGDSTPLVPNDSPENEALNRRIEIELY